MENNSCFSMVTMHNFVGCLNLIETRNIYIYIIYILYFKLKTAFNLNLKLLFVLYFIFITGPKEKIVGAGKQ